MNSLKTLNMRINVVAILQAIKRVIEFYEFERMDIYTLHCIKENCVSDISRSNRCIVTSFDETRFTLRVYIDDKFVDIDVFFDFTDNSVELEEV